MTMPIPDWVARETRHLHLGCFHVLSAMFTDGAVTTLEDGTVEYALREEWPVEEAVMDADAARRVWKQLRARGLVEYRGKDHMALSGRMRGSYVCQDRKTQNDSVPNRVGRNCDSAPQVSIRAIAGTEWPKGPIESEGLDPSRARVRDIIPRDACAATHQPSTTSTSSASSPTATTAPPTTAQPEITSLEDALEIIGFTEDGQAKELMAAFGRNNVAVAIRYLVRGLQRAKRKLQPPVASPTGYVIQHLGANARVKFEEVDDFGFLGELGALLSSPSVIEFRTRGE